jgi:putative transposase
MSETLESVATEVDQKQLAEQLLAQAKEQGIELVGPNGLLNQLTKNVLETALDAEMSEHLGYDKHDPAGRGSGNSRNGTRAKTVFTEIGPVEVEVPRDTNSSFDPQIVKKRQRRLTGIDEIVLSLTAKGLTTGEIAAHFDDVYGATVSKDTISRITDKVIEEMTEWCNRPLESGQSLADVANLRQEMSDATWRTEPPTGAGQAVVLRAGSNGDARR